MFKQMTLAAMAIVATSAFAQSTTTTTVEYKSAPGWNKADDIDLEGKSIHQLRKKLEWRANDALSGGDRTTLVSLLNRAPSNVEQALLMGLSKSHRQAVMINDQMLAWRFPADTTVSTTTTNGYSTTTTTTTYDNNMNWSAMDWSSAEANSRPMRMIMTKSAKPKDISYDQAIEILTSDLNDTQAGTLSSWWFSRASVGQKDVVVRLLKDDAAMADQTYYPSVYSRRTYSWTTTTNP